jgi:transcriptional regulator with XRE-family HTH domain
MEENKDFNRIAEWMDPKVREMGLSIEQFSRLCGLSKAVICFYREDIHRPSEQAMIKICRVLGVPPEEGLQQYTRRKNGRPVLNNPRNPEGAGL